MFTRKTTRASAAAASSSVAGPSTDQTPTTSTREPMRTRSGKLLAPLAEGVKTVRAKLAGGRRGAKVPAEAPARAEASKSAQADATSSNVATPAPAPAPRKAAPKKRATTARGRTTKAKASKAKPAPAPAPAASPTPEAAPAPVPTPVAGPSEASTSIPSSASASNADASASPAVPAHRPLQRQSTRRFEKSRADASLDKDGSASLSALLAEVEEAFPLEYFMRGRMLKPSPSIYGIPSFQPQLGAVYEPLQIEMPFEPIVFPSVPARNLGTPISRQYAAIFDQDGYPIPVGEDGPGEAEPIGEIVANILKASHKGPYPPTWRGSLFESDDAPVPAYVAPAIPAPAPAPVPAPEPASAADNVVPGARPVRPLPPPGRRLRRHHAILIDLDGPADEEAPPRHTPLQRHNAVYLDKDGVALPEGEVTTAEKQFPDQPAPRDPHDRASFPKVIDLGVDKSAPGLGALFARRSRSQMAVYKPDAATGVTKEDARAPAPAPVEEDSAPDAAPAADAGSPSSSELAEEEEVIETLSTFGKGKKRARSPEDENEDGAGADEEDAPRVQRMRMVSIRSHTTTCSLLRAKVSVIPIPVGIKCRDKLVLFPEGTGPAPRSANKRSREEFEGEDGAPEGGEDERAAKKARVDDF